MRKSKKLPRDYISYTQVLTYLECPAKYRAKYELGIVPETSYEMRRGSVMHTALKAINDQAAAGGDDQMAPEDVDRALNAALRADTRPGEIKPFDVGEMGAALRSCAFDIAKKTKDFVGAEVEFTIPYKGAKLLVIIDRLDAWGHDGIRITDYKYAKKILSKTALREDLQLLIYFYAVIKNDPSVQRGQLVQYMLRYNFPNVVELDADQAQGVERYLDFVIEGILGKRYEPRLNPYCYSCEIRGRCDAYKKRFVVNHEEIKGIDDANAEYEKLRSAAASIEQRQAEVRGFIGDLVERRGPRRTSDGLVSWEYSTQEGQRPDVAKLAELFRRYGLDIIPLMGITGDNLDVAQDQLFRRISRPEVQAFIKERDALMERHVKTVLRQARVKDCLTTPANKKKIRAVKARAKDHAR